MKPSENETIDHLAEKARRSPDFTDDDVRAIKLMADAWRGFEALGRVAKVVRSIAIYLGWMIGGYIAVKLFLVDWIRSIK